jgi:hypothetical protein
LNVILAGLTDSETGGAFTVRVIGTVRGLLLALGAVIVTEPEYVPIGSPVGFTVTRTANGAIPLFGLTLSQPPPVGVDTAADAVNGRAVEPPLTEMFCVGGSDVCDGSYV